MDILHPIDSTEQLIAQGEYNYQISSKDSGLREFWSLHKLPDGTLVHRAEVHGSITLLSLTQQSHFVLTPGYQPYSLQMSQNIQDKAAARIARTTIRCFEQSVMQTIETENLSDKKVIEVPSAYSLFFPPVSAQGFIVANYDLETGGRQHLPLVSIRIQPESGLPLSVEMQTIDYEYQENDREIETPAGQFACYHFVRYDQHMEQHLWVDQNWIAIQWSVPYSEIMKWEYLLTRYHRER
jgi:hypothetical protein